MTTHSSPAWPHCAHGAGPADPVGCRGIHVPGHIACVAHLPDTDRDTYLAGLTPGADIDHRGTPFTEGLLNQLLNAVRDPNTADPHLGDARFEEAQFSRDSNFAGAQFFGDALFDGARFSGVARFVGAQFLGIARFIGAQFSQAARFDEAQFSDAAWFVGARFSGAALFGGAQFSSNVRFSGAYFSRNARFDGVQFLMAWEWGPVMCEGRVVLSGAVFGAPATLEIAAKEVVCTRTRWQSTATVRVRHASVDLGHAVLEAPLAVTAHPTPFTTSGGTLLDETVLSGSGAVRVVSVQGVDAAHLVLTDTDLSDCLFSGGFHLDQLRLEGCATLASTPTGWHRKGIAPVRWTRRRTLPRNTTGARRPPDSPPSPPVRRLSLVGGVRARTTPTPPAPPTPTMSPPCTGSCARRSRTPRTNPAPPTSTTASARCAATIAPAPRQPNAACCGPTGCSPATACAPVAPWAGWRPPCSPRSCC
ncbi:pentapeptide repeat-containing protein [Streptomyces hydrogenans]|uniref:pentapeptide repeat-containing protein n=1 Tax=Streptomyces hydrogenans TaxID=1873719 RepID=UPI0036CB186A